MSGIVRRGAPRASLAGAALLAAALSACASFGIGQSEQKPVNPNLFPDNYKAALMSYLQQNPYGLVGARAAELSAPELKPFGNESRYVVCMRAAGPDWRKEKMAVFFAGTINQFIDATPEACATATYQAFPEITTLLGRLSGSKK